MISQEISSRLKNYSFQTFTHDFDKKTVHIFVQVFNEYAYICCADEEYPVNIGKKFINECYKLINKNGKIISGSSKNITSNTSNINNNISSNTSNNIDQLLCTYQDPKSHDLLENIQKELKATKELSCKTLASLLERNEKLEDLVEKSEQLSSSSKIFYKAAHKRNRCC